jgi:hypothetical protein
MTKAPFGRATISLRSGAAAVVATFLILGFSFTIYGQKTGLSTREHVAVSAIRSRYETASPKLPEKDSEDTIELPAWFRAYLRSNLQSLPDSGRPQYPRDSRDMLRWLQANKYVQKEELEEKLQRLRREIPAVVKENKRRKLYPPEWEVPIKQGTKLAEFANRLDAQFNLLPDGDSEDRTPLPIWFRVYFRKLHPEMPQTGSYQYPRNANRILQELLDKPNDIQANSTAIRKQYYLGFGAS